MKIEDHNRNLGLEAISAWIFDNKVKHDWDITDRESWKNSTTQVPADLALIHSEISEALEAFRSDNIDQFGMEMADAMARIIGLCDALGLPLWQNLIRVVQKSSERPYKHGGKRL